MSVNFMMNKKMAPARIRLRSFAWFAMASGLSALAAAQAPSAPSAMPAAAPVTAPASAPPMKGVAHIAIRVKDIAAAVAFYNKLGFEQAFAMTKGDLTTQSFIKLNDRQFIELYPITDGDTQIGFLHLCFEGGDLNPIHDYYVAEGLTPIAVRKAGAGNMLFTMKGPQQFADPQNIEYTQYMPESMHSKDVGQHLGPDRVGDRMTVVALAMQDPVAARAFYVSKLGFSPVADHPARLNLPGASGEQVEIVPIDTLGRRSSIILETSDIDKAAAQLTRQKVEFKRAGADLTDGKGKTAHVEMISVTDPDGNIIRITSSAASRN